MKHIYETATAWSTQATLDSFFRKHGLPTPSERSAIALISRPKGKYKQGVWSNSPFFYLTVFVPDPR